MRLRNLIFSSSLPRGLEWLMARSGVSLVMIASAGGAALDFVSITQHFTWTEDAVLLTWSGIAFVAVLLRMLYLEFSIYRAIGVAFASALGGYDIDKCVQSSFHDEMYLFGAIICTLITIRLYSAGPKEDRMTN